VARSAFLLLAWLIGSSDAPFRAIRVRRANHDQGDFPWLPFGHDLSFHALLAEVGEGLCVGCAPLLLDFGIPLSLLITHWSIRIAVAQHLAAQPPVDVLQFNGVVNAAGFL
jgi:hypothetical protein